MKTNQNDDFLPAASHAELATGEVIQMLRDLKGWTQEELAKRSGISATNISLLENGRVDIGKKRAELFSSCIWNTSYNYHVSGIRVGGDQKSSLTSCRLLAF